MSLRRLVALRHLRDSDTASEPFFRVAGSTSGKALVGTGLALSTATELNCWKWATFSRWLIPAMSRLPRSRHWRDVATAWKVLVIDQLQRIYDTHRRVALQEVHRVKALFPVDVDQVLEVPTHHHVHLVHDGHGHMIGVLGI